jgi:hypothetical protein
MTLLELFLALAAYTTPHGTEAYCIPYLPTSHWMDDKGNIHVWVPKPDGSDSETMFSSHLDTADSRMKRTTFHLDEDTRMLTTDGKTIMGADDKIGVALMCKMIEASIPGWYVFHVGEEVGLKGSEYIRNHGKEMLSAMKRCIAFDRKGYTSVITHQCSERTCSQEFALALSSQLLDGFTPDHTGAFTDSYSYRYCIPECTNISVGYFQQHQHTEKQDVGFAERLLEKLLKVDWENLPTNRTPVQEEDDAPPPYRFRSGKYTPADHDIDMLPDDEWKKVRREVEAEAQTYDWDSDEKMDDAPDDPSVYDVVCPRCTNIQECSMDEPYPTCSVCYEDLSEIPPADYLDLT